MIAVTGALFGEARTGMNRTIAVGSVLLLAYLAIAFAFSTRVENQVTIQGEAERVFDTITTAKYWPQWHPATLGVSGAIDKPMQLGDVIVERANIFGIPGTAEWRVTEWTRPTSVKLESQGSLFARATIQYEFSPSGDSVRFTRTLDYAFIGFGGPLDWFWIKPIMENQSARAIENLKAFVEKQ